MGGLNCVKVLPEGYEVVPADEHGVPSTTIPDDYYWWSEQFQDWNRLNDYVWCADGTFARPVTAVQPCLVCDHHMVDPRDPDGIEGAHDRWFRLAKPGEEA